MLSALTSLFNLRWSRQAPLEHPLPTYVSRNYIHTASNSTRRLEILSTEPPRAPSNSNSPPQRLAPPPPPSPLLFLHGGFGSASVYIPFMTALHGTTQCFALSLRNHGASDPVSYLRMVYGVGISDLAEEIVAAIEHVVAVTGSAPVLVGHSSGGGLAQYVLATSTKGARARVRVRGLVLLDAVPHFGMLPVYVNWARHDPWFGVRMLVHGFHVASPLSSVGLVRGAFFGDGSGRSETGRPASDAEVVEFMRWMPGCESLMWPLAMFGSFWGWLVGRPSWLDVKDVIAGLELGNDVSVNRDSICIVVGDRDVLMDVKMCRMAAEQYRNGVKQLVAEKKVDGTGIDNQLDMQETDGEIVERGGGVRSVVVKGAGHHVQNDVQWKVAAEALKRFIVQA